MAVLRLEMTVFTHRKASKSLDLRGLTTIAPSLATTAAARLAKASVTRWTLGSRARVAQVRMVSLVI